jgi:hypothetical protein
MAEAFIESLRGQMIWRNAWQYSARGNGIVAASSDCSGLQIAPEKGT